MTDLAGLSNHVACLVDIETESLHEHLDRSLLNLKENLVLVLEVEDQELVLFFGAMDGVLEHEVLDIDQAFLEVIVVQ